MSLPQTGLVVVKIGEEVCRFDGARWGGENASLVKLLNLALGMVPKHHYAVEEIASRCLRVAGVQGEVVESRQDAWGADEQIAGID